MPQAFSTARNRPLCGVTAILVFDVAGKRADRIFNGRKTVGDSAAEIADLGQILINTLCNAGLLVS